MGSLFSRPQALKSLIYCWYTPQTLCALPAFWSRHKARRGNSRHGASYQSCWFRYCCIPLPRGSSVPASGESALFLSRYGHTLLSVAAMQLDDFIFLSFLFFTFDTCSGVIRMMMFKAFLLYVLIASSLSTSFSPFLAGVLADYLHFRMQTIYERNLCPEELTMQIQLAFRRPLVLFVKQSLH